MTDFRDLAAQLADELQRRNLHGEELREWLTRVLELGATAGRVEPLSPSEAQLEAEAEEVARAGVAAIVAEAYRRGLVPAGLIPCAKCDAQAVPA